MKHKLKNEVFCNGSIVSSLSIGVYNLLSNLSSRQRSIGTYPYSESKTVFFVQYFLRYLMKQSGYFRDKSRVV